MFTWLGTEGNPQYLPHGGQQALPAGFRGGAVFVHVPPAFSSPGDALVPGPLSKEGSAASPHLWLLCDLTGVSTMRFHSFLHFSIWALLLPSIHLLSRESCFIPLYPPCISVTQSWVLRLLTPRADLKCALKGDLFPARVLQSHRLNALSLGPN